MGFVNMLSLTGAGLVSSITGKKQEVILSRMEAERDLIAHNGGQVGIAEGAIMIVTAAVTLGIGSMILGQIMPSVVGTDEASNASIAVMKTSTWGAMGLLPIALTVFAAVIILGAVAYLRQ